VFERLTFTGPDLLVELVPDHSVSQLTLVGPDEQTYTQTRVAEGARQARLQLLSKAGRFYPAGDYRLAAEIGKTTVSETLSLRPDLRITDVVPEYDEGQHTTGRLLVTVENIGSGPTWVYNIGVQNVPFPNAPEIIDGIADATFEQPDSKEEFLSPDAERTFLKTREILVFKRDGGVSCDGGEVTFTVVVQTPHGDTSRSLRAGLSGGYNIDDQLAVRSPCQNVALANASGGDDGV
jgi:hypothetical protein